MSRSMRIYLIGFGSSSLIFVILGCWFYVSSANDKSKPNEKNSKVIYRDKEVIKKVLVRDPLPNKFVDIRVLIRFGYGTGLIQIL